MSLAFTTVRQGFDACLPLLASQRCPVSLCESFFFLFFLSIEESLLKPKKQHHTVDHLARGSMKNGASSET